MPHYYWIMDEGQAVKIEKVKTVLLPDGTATFSAPSNVDQLSFKEPPLVSFESLRKLVEKHNVRSIDQLLPLLPLECRKFYTWVYQSESKKGSRPKKMAKTSQ